MAVQGAYRSIFAVRRSAAASRGRLQQLANAAALSLVSASLALTACSRGDGSWQGGHGGPVPVTVASVVEQTVAEQLHAIGSVQPYSTVAIKARVGGQLTSVSFSEGQAVKQGDVLFTIDARPFQADLQQAQANLVRDQAKARQAEQEDRRWDYMAKRGLASPERYEQAQADAQALRAAVDADKAALQSARLNVEYCTIRSPIDGRTGSLILHRGNLVKANADQPLVVVNQLRPVYVDFSVPEKELTEIRRQMAIGALPVQATIPAPQAHPVSGVINFIDNEVDRSTGTIRLKGLFENRDERLWPGQFVDVTLTLAERPHSLLVPSHAVQTGQEGQYVYVVGLGTTAELRPVVVGDVTDGKTIVERGLKRGETVVTDGQLRLFPGAKVQIKGGLDGKRPSAS